MRWLRRNRSVLNLERRFAGRFRMGEQEKSTISRRSFLTKAAGAALAASLPAGAKSAAVPKSTAGNKSHGKGKRPLNVLFFMSDDMRPELASYNSRFNAQARISMRWVRTAFASTATTASFRCAIRRGHRCSLDICRARRAFWATARRW